MFFELSSRGLSHAASAAWTKDFSFIVGGHEYQVNKLNACFISPKVAELLLTDPSNDVFYIDTDDSEYQFKQIVKLMEGGILNYDDEVQSYLMNISPLLGNKEMIQKTLEQLTDVNCDNIVDRVNFKVDNGLDIKNEISFMARHFTEISIKEKQKLGVCILSDVLSHPSLSVFSEDALFDEIYSMGPEFSDELIAFVEFELLSIEKINQIVDTMIDYTNISRNLWNGLTKRLKAPTKIEDNYCQYRHKGIYEKFFNDQTNNHERVNATINSIINEHPYEHAIDEKEFFNGIIHYLTTKCGGNVHSKKVIKITSSSNGFNKPYQVADFGWKSYWNTEYQSNAWIKYDFKKMKIQLSNYSIKTGYWDGVHLQNWVIEGSSDGEKWKIIDERKTKELNGNFITKSFKCESNEAFRYIRLRQINESAFDCLELCNLEFFGRLYRND
ncbi:hypothetical protein TRFO_32623 [Tritrichomonas foetus]|uniref:F5/8 type C domain-containing protein n=1 Tax=Tritrichomonas foetus TaxID=1144522 RepID=A0A1J4JT07_9EUKA|nr:hypothetical protein TRFO_32623 [Tritrichomonas foetus]|eukprot:OHT00654.1 hypothetical protein TRFO_32623 [Tritrichomonas foetus]